MKIVSLKMSYLFKKYNLQKSELYMKSASLVILGMCRLNCLNSGYSFNFLDQVSIHSHSFPVPLCANKIERELDNHDQINYCRNASKWRSTYAT